MPVPAQNKGAATAGRWVHVAEHFALCNLSAFLRRIFLGLDIHLSPGCFHVFGDSCDPGTAVRWLGVAANLRGVAQAALIPGKPA